MIAHMGIVAGDYTLCKGKSRHAVFSFQGNPAHPAAFTLDPSNGLGWYEPP